jgi:hypothetical protein
MKFGGNNNPADVAKFQAFLKDTQGQNVTVNGTFDQQTENAVRAFQSKYMSQIMGPWGASQSSGYVYITTLKKVNELACNTSLTLSPAETAIVNAYKNQQNQNVAPASVGPTTPGSIVIPGTINTTVAPNASTTNTVASTSPDIGQSNAGAAANTAAVVNATGFQKFWNFIKSIF